MKRILSVFLLLVMLVGMTMLFGCQSVSGNGSPKTQFFETDSENYTLIIDDLSIGGYKPHFSIDKRGQNRVEVQADENVLSALNVEVNNETHTIKIALKEKTKLRPSYFAINVSCMVKKVELNGDYDIDWVLPQVRNFYATVNGDVKGTIINQDLYKYEIVVNGKTDIKASGKAEKFTMELNGGGKFEGYKLETTTSCKVNVNGSADVEITANGSLFAEVQGKGNITYDGSPIATTKYVKGKGKILSRADAAEKDK